MSTKTITRGSDLFPSILNDYFKPWNEWFNGDGLLQKMATAPSVNIAEEKDRYNVSLAVPGMDKKDFSVEQDGNMLTISAEKEESKEEKEKKYTRKEYNYSSFSRSFTLPEDVSGDKIEAKYENGILSLILPKNEQTKSNSSKKIVVN